MNDLVRLTRGVWRPTDADDDLPARAAALLSVCAPQTVVAGISAARLHGLWLPDQSTAGPLDVIVHPALVRPAARSSCRRREVRSRRRLLAADEVTTVAGLPVTTEARTWLDLAATLDLPDLVAAGDSALRGGTTLTDLAVVVARARNCPGVMQARAALPHLDARSRSRPESVLRFGLVNHGLPKPAINQAILNDQGEWLAEPDLHYQDARLAIEYNGSLHADIPRMRDDMTRGVDVIGGGWISVAAGPVQVFRRMDQLARVIARLRGERLSVGSTLPR